jgi:hypothetical protein
LSATAIRAPHSIYFAKRRCSASSSGSISRAVSSINWTHRSF